VTKPIMSVWQLVHVGGPVKYDELPTKHVFDVGSVVSCSFFSACHFS